MRTLKAVPRCIRGPYLRILTQCLVAVESSQVAWNAGTGNEVSVVQAWKIFLLLPRMLLHKAKRGGEAGERERKRRIELFDAGQWDELLLLSRNTVTRVRTPCSDSEKHG